MLVNLNAAEGVRCNERSGRWDARTLITCHGEGDAPGGDASLGFDRMAMAIAM